MIFLKIEFPSSRIEKEKFGKNSYYLLFSEFIAKYAFFGSIIFLI